MKINVVLPIDEVEKLGLANRRFDCSDEILSGSQLVSWAVHMVLAAYDQDDK